MASTPKTLSDKDKKIIAEALADREAKLKRGVNTATNPAIKGILQDELRDVETLKRELS